MLSDSSATMTTRNETPFSAKQSGGADRGERHAGEQRPEHAREVELNRVQRDGVRKILLLDERRHQRLIGRSAERLRESGDERQRQDVPDVDAPQ